MRASGFDGARVRIRAAKRALLAAKKTYEASLSAKQVAEDLLLEVAQIVEHLRSALDYCAHELYERSGAREPARHDVRVYFPVLREGKDWGSVLGRCIPGIMDSRPDIAAALEQWQVTKAPHNQWLPDLASLAVESKHRQLIPQTRKTQRSLDLRGGSVAISMGEGTSMSIGPGASISIGGHVIGGGPTIGVGRPPFGFTGNATEITWVAFVWEIDGRQVNVLSFLDQALEGTEQIVEELSRIAR